MHIIRPYKVSDWDSFLDLESETIGRASFPQGASTTHLRSHCEKILAENHQWKNKLPESQNNKIFIIEKENSDYAGHLWLSTKEDQLTGENKYWIMSLAIKEAFRQQGLGRALLRHAIKEALEQGYASIGLSVACTNSAAQKLYTKEGFSGERITMSLRLETKR